ncbi:uncharacterized protein UV8b_01055 [Ustilaginoidea virens]|uniref:Uncharacterized protein n=1 Tax=Ustilaginoidea virens TaxID=1159556 RepID=A0A8E5HKT5_USTVR|nr:uncharacterized protein UV8b_01055 [Ustilaginoidea virens]QUC16814.1 hypothetical protein UV8b_01055 [Ustilaginoidea virens]
MPAPLRRQAQQPGRAGCRQPTHGSVNRALVPPSWTLGSTRAGTQGPTDSSVKGASESRPARPAATTCGICSVRDLLRHGRPAQPATAGVYVSRRHRRLGSRVIAPFCSAQLLLMAVAGMADWLATRVFGRDRWRRVQLPGKARLGMDGFGWPRRITNGV